MINEETLEDLKLLFVSCICCKIDKKVAIKEWDSILIELR
jgi:hypothetical protein